MKSDVIPLSDEIIIKRELKEGNNAYGVRRYLLLPRNEFEDYNVGSSSQDIIASINANQNMMFGLQLHQRSTTFEDGIDNIDFTEFLNTCGPLLDIAKEDASVNGQQPQVLCALNGLCAWVRGCLDNNGDGSKVLDVLMHGAQSDSSMHEIPVSKTDERPNKSISDTPRSRQRIQNKSKAYTVKDESTRLIQLEAITAIATSTPRPGHSVLGAGTFRAGHQPWIHLAWEYCSTSSPWDVTCKSGLEELMCCKSRNGEVAAIEHLAHREDGYLKSAGGAMARLFFV